jgi:predicted nucleic acid-binding protein
VIVDTSVWVDHLRRGNRRLTANLGRGVILGHPFVIGELACGNLHNREEVLALLASLTSAAIADHEEALSLVERRHLGGRGLGWVDIHLLASAILSRAPLLTLDRRLAEVATDLGVAA